MTYVIIILYGLFTYLSNDNSAHGTRLVTEEYQNTGGKDETYLDDTTNHLVWFIHISDLHLSEFRDPTRTIQLLDFANNTVSVINPAVVLASGDLTDAKNINIFSSKQNIYEWLVYKDILHSTNVINKTVWLDIRGNHDCYNVAGDKENLYKRYSIQGRYHDGSYTYVHKYGFDTIAFIAIDACPVPGPKWPFNFFGSITDSEMYRLERLEATSHTENNYTVWFGHYPTSCIQSPKPGIRNLMGRRGLAYMCGHLHTAWGLVPRMHIRHATGSLELELGDWKEHRIFRVAAVDHGMLSFTDVKYDSWPIILITNPQRALYSRIEPSHLSRHSSHIRMLIWSPAPIIEARVWVDISNKWMQLNQIGDGSLYVSNWNSSNVEKGLHTLKVFAKDANDREATVHMKFSFDGSLIPLSDFGFGSRALLDPDIMFIGQFLFGITTSISIIPLFIFRARRRHYKPCIMYRKLWILVRIDRLFWPLIAYSILFLVCPWFVGYIIDDHIGYIFAWGTVVNGTYIPDSLTYWYGFLHLLFFQIPLIINIAHLAYARLYYNVDRERRHWSYILPRTYLAILIIIQITTAYIFSLSYGFMVIFLASLPIRSIILELVLWYQTTTLSREKFKTTILARPPN